MTKKEFLYRLEHKNMQEIRDLATHSARLMEYLDDKLPDHISERACDTYLTDSALLGKLRPPEVTGSMMIQTIKSAKGA